MSFTDLKLDPAILKAIAACGYTTPTPIQAKAIPIILDDKDIVASAHTGSGKTAAFVLPALHRLSQAGPSKQTRILILTPTRELASQITAAATQYGKFLRFNIVNLVGGMPYHQQIRELSRGADIIVATPGRLMDHIEAKRVNLSGIEMLVLDEADRMLDMGFIEDVEYIAKLTPAKRQTLLFSATVDKSLANVVRHLLKNPVRVDLSNEKLAVPQIEQLLYKATSPHHKVRLLSHFLREGNIFKAIIFSGTKINADKIADRLCDDGFAAAALHGDLRQNVRNRTIEQLRRGKIQFLVATDVAARGIDINDVTHVINYDLPRFCEDYVHRIGRTGRAGKTGVAISFVLPTDMRNLQRIERFTGQRLKLISNVDVGLHEKSEPREPREREEREHAPRHHDKKPNFKRDYQRADAPRRNSDSPRRRAAPRHSDDAPRHSERPFKKRFAAGSSRSSEDHNERSTFARTSDRPFKRRDEERDAPAARRNSDRPFKKREESRDAPAARRSSGDKPFKKRFGADEGRKGAPARDGSRPFKKPFAKSTEGSRTRTSKADAADPTLRKRITGKTRKFSDKRS